MNLDQLRAFAKGLLSLSARFEGFVPGAKPSLVETMSQLSGLEKLARQSLAESAPKAEAAQKPDAQPQRVAGVGASAARQAEGVPIGDSSLSKYSVSRQDHRPALRNPSVVQALLALHARSRPRRSILIKSEEMSPAPPSPRTDEPATSPRFHGADFMVEELPTVDVVPKHQPAFRSTSAATHSILRPASHDKT